MRSTARRAFDGAGGAGSADLARKLAWQTIQTALFTAIVGGLLWLVWIYGNGLRDPRYLDGWVLAAGMILQLGFHVAKTTGSLSPISATRWKRFHILVGYLLIATFVSHSDFSLPDTGFEWALWSGFVLVTLSGAIGAYLTWRSETKDWADGSITIDRIPAMRAKLAHEVQAIVAEPDPAADRIALPALPHDAWIADLYAAHLQFFFDGPPGIVASLTGSQRPLKRLIAEIDRLSPYLDLQGQEKLAAIKSLAIEKDRLERARLRLTLSGIWLLVHVPATYALIVLSVTHVLVVYAFSSGAW